MLKMSPETSKTYNGEDFCICKKEICSIAVYDELTGEEKFTEYQRLEFQNIRDQDYILDWLEPVIYDGEPALILHCKFV